MTDPILELARDIVRLQLDWIKNVDQEWYARTPVDKLDEAEASEIVNLLREKLKQVGDVTETYFEDEDGCGYIPTRFSDGSEVWAVALNENQRVRPVYTIDTGGK